MTERVHDCGCSVTQARWDPDGVVLKLLLVGLAALYLLLLSVEPHRYVTHSRSECPAQLKLLQTAQKVYHAEFDEYVEVAWWGQDPVVQGLPSEPYVAQPNEGMQTLGWATDGPVLGLYRVRVRDDGEGFTASCVIDTDYDGEAAEYRATESTQPERRTPNYVQ